MRFFNKVLKKRYKIQYFKEFDQVCKVMHIGKAISPEGDFDSPIYGEEDTLVIVFRKGRKIYRGLVPVVLLATFPISNPQTQKYYRFQSRKAVLKRETYSLVYLSSILPI